ncbi:hypothetical protein BV898_07371 [Hypsibius exemplaris]|uniref:Uncharacterized protein n=1 Tax=Hypsibius exemplaris TaxID=2072580 RepID=A0A1W0WTL8_HYPEX|nr:hypothetical protein BV898_07371 [Hypsibius exemplaris]
MTIRAIFVCSAVLAVCLAERISQTPDVTWNRSPSSSSSNSRNSFSSSGSSDNDRFPITGGSSGSRSPSRGSQTETGFGFDGDNSRFPITGGSGSRFGSSGSIGSSSDSRFGSSSGSGSRGSGSGFGSSFDRTTTQDPTKNYYVRIIASLIQLNNSKSATATGSSCATFGKCDPIVFADLDTDRPNANWPGARDTKLWSQVFTGKSLDSFNVGIDNITKDICGQNYREADLRVRVEDKKTLTSNAVINEFDCPINRVPQESQITATWSPVTMCLPRFPKGMQSLSFRYKVFYVSRFSCGMDTPITTTTKSSFFG